MKKTGDETVKREQGEGSAWEEKMNIWKKITIMTSRLFYTSKNTKL
jgi:hypothetical protein